MATTKPGRTVAADKKKDWQPFPREAYETLMHGLVHFSAKTSNSNTPAFGIRLSTAGRSELPYVAVSTMADIPADYTSTGNNGANAKMLAQVEAAIEGTTEQTFSGAPADEITDIRNLAASILPGAFEHSASAVSMRLRQIIVQDAAGNDLALTPLQSAGFSKVLVERVFVVDTAEGKHPRRHRGLLGVGGANPQNVGRYVRAMHRPLYFNAPTENRELRVAFALHFKGISLTPPRPLLQKYHLWRQKRLLQGGGSLLSNAASRDEENEFIRQVTMVILKRASDARAILLAHQEDLPDRELLASRVDPIVRHLFIPSERGFTWAGEFAETLQRQIINSSFFLDGEKVTIGVGEYESATWIDVIKGMV